MESNTVSAVCTPANRRQWVSAVVVLVAAAGGLQACSEALDIGPSIDSLTLEPSAVRKQETGMTDEYIAVDMQISGFESQIQDATIFDEERQQEAEYDAATRTISDGRIQIAAERGGILKSWLGGLQPGTYDVGAKVNAENADIKERNLTEVTVCTNSGPCP